MRKLPRRDRPLESPAERSRRALSRLLPGRFVKQQRAYAVRLGDTTVKRLVLADSGAAERIAGLVERVRETGVAPAPLARDGRELWLEFVEGTPVTRGDAGLAEEIVALLAKLWALEPRREDPAACGLVVDLERDLDFLAAAGVLGREQRARVGAWIEGQIPESIWFGVDYTDLRAANLLRSADGCLRIVDVESLSRSVPLGTSVAKASLGWLAPHRAEILDGLAERGLPDVRPDWSFISLVFLARWQKRSVLRGKWKLVDPALFDRPDGPDGPDRSDRSDRTER